MSDVASRIPSFIPSDWTELLLAHFAGLNAVPAYGETSFFYNPEMKLPKGAYFCTIKENNGPADRASGLDRPGVYRLNFGLSKPTFLDLFGCIPKRAAKGQCIEGPYNFTQLQQLMPHPIYGWMCWVGILNPAKAQIDELLPLLAEGYAQACRNYAKRMES